MRRLTVIVLILLLSNMNIGNCTERYVTFGIGKMDGDNTYSIGGKVFGPGVGGAGELQFPISELEFDIDVYMASLGAGIGFAEKWKIFGEFRKNISSGSGVLKDSDYLTTGYSAIPEIYSESNVDLDAWSAEISLQYRFLEGLYGGVGYLYQNFDYNLKDFRQWSPLGTADEYSAYGPGLGLTYDVRYHIPYLKLGAKGNISDEMLIETSVRYSPKLWAKDRDNHVARGIYAEGDCEGTAWFFSLIAQYNFPNHWFMTFAFDYAKITTDGDQKNYVNSQWQWTTDEEIESNQTYFTLTAGYRF